VVTIFYIKSNTNNSGTHVNSGTSFFCIILIYLIEALCLLYNWILSTNMIHPLCAWVNLYGTLQWFLNGLESLPEILGSQCLWQFYYNCSFQVTIQDNERTLLWSWWFLVWNVMLPILQQLNLPCRLTCLDKHIAIIYNFLPSIENKGNMAITAPIEISFLCNKMELLLTCLLLVKHQTRNGLSW